MSRLRFPLLCLLALMMTAPVSSAGTPAPPATVVVVLADGTISPASADYIVRGIKRAQTINAAAVVLELDTPGGLASSMRTIVTSTLASEVPVIGYVAPRGSRAASAGTFILYACHVAAMAPATNIGAATPVSLTGGGPPLPTPNATGSEPPPQKGDAEMRKTTNDAVAFIRSLAERSGRNANWAEQAVRAAVSVSDQEALKLHVIDLVAADLPGLLAEVDGREVRTASGTRILHTRNAVLEHIEPGWHSRFLGVVADPSIAYILLLLGLGGLVMEGMHPGGIVPGVVGTICLLLALYGFQMLPVNYVGLALILLGVILIVSEAFVPAYGVLGIGGATSLVLGSVLLMDTDVPGFAVARPLVIGVALSAAGVIAGISWLAVRSHRRPVVSGREEMQGAMAEVVADFDGLGVVHVHGERWQAHANGPLRRGQRVVVVGRQGLVLEVEPVTSSKEIAQ
ncbi:MAG: nodulation protein NfeD [Proteobacteria bacterium]|nr:nodulation protein NfeD [Pseudomonadota bacterium]